MNTQTKTDKELKLQQELSNTTDKQNSLIDIEALDNTPFGIVTIEGKSFGVIGQNRITGEYTDIEELKEDLSIIDWNKVVNVVWNVCDLYWKGKMINDKTQGDYRDWETDRKSTRLNSSHITRSRMPSSA